MTEAQIRRFLAIEEAAKRYRRAWDSFLARTRQEQVGPLTSEVTESSGHLDKVLGPICEICGDWRDGVFHLRKSDEEKGVENLEDKHWFKSAKEST